MGILLIEQQEVDSHQQPFGITLLGWHLELIESLLKRNDRRGFAIYSSMPFAEPT
jgi:hypothetical protein